MPLRAYIDSREVISVLLEEDEWTELKTDIKRNGLEVVIAQTSKLGYLRTSKNGLQHFVHKNGEKPEGWKPESIEHLKAKSHIVKGCNRAGWDLTTEYSEDDWRADVLASKSNERIAFEVQWSYQTADVTKER